MGYKSINQTNEYINIFLCSEWKKIDTFTIISVWLTQTDILHKMRKLWSKLKKKKNSDIVRGWMKKGEEETKILKPFCYKILIINLADTFLWKCFIV